MKISIIAAIGRKRELGKDNKLLWRISEDMQRFREITRYHPVIMGRKTFESIGRPLPERKNIVVTRDKKYKAASCTVCYSLEEAIEVAKSERSDEIFIIGGGQIYNQAMPLADKLYLTLIDDEKEADTFFPDYSKFKKVVFEKNRESDGLRYNFLELEKRE